MYIKQKQNSTRFRIILQINMFVYLLYAMCQVGGLYVLLRQHL